MIRFSCATKKSVKDISCFNFTFHVQNLIGGKIKSFRMHELFYHFYKKNLIFQEGIADFKGSAIPLDFRLD